MCVNAKSGGSQFLEVSGALETCVKKLFSYQDMVRCCGIGAKTGKQIVKQRNRVDSPEKPYLLTGYVMKLPGVAWEMGDPFATAYRFSSVK